MRTEMFNRGHVVVMNDPNLMSNVEHYASDIMMSSSIILLLRCETNFNMCVKCVPRQQLCMTSFPLTYTLTLAV